VLLSLVMLAIFLTVTLGMLAGFYAVTGLVFRDTELMRQRVSDEFRKDRREDAPRSPLFKNMERLSLPETTLPMEGSASQPAGAVAEAASEWRLMTLLQQADLESRLATTLKQAELSFTPRQLLTAAAALGLFLGVCAAWLRGPVAATAAAALGSALPLLYVARKCRLRREKLLTQLPNAFDLMARVIRSGQSVPQALQAVSDTFEQPIAGEFSNCQKRQNLGLRPEVAFNEMAQENGILELRIFVMAMLIQRQTGGNLSEVLERLSNLLRERLRIRKRVSTLTAEGRLQGWTLLVLPFVVYGAMLVVNRPYALILLDHGMLLAFTGLSMAIGALWMRKIVNIEP
jgi:tight adherence protein B